MKKKSSITAVLPSKNYSTRCLRTKATIINKVRSKAKEEESHFMIY